MKAEKITGAGGQKGDYMKEKIIKSTIIQMIGFAAVKLPLFAYNPLAIAYYVAIQCSRMIRWPALPIMVIGMFFSMDVLSVAKYGLIMMSISIIFWIIENGKSRVNIIAGALIGSVIMFAMEMTDIYLKNQGARQTAYAVIASILAFALSVIIYKVFLLFLSGGARRKKNIKRGRKEQFDMMNTYEERISHISKAFERMAKCVEEISKTVEPVKENNCRCKECTTLKRQNRIFRNKLNESKKVIALQLLEMSKILKTFSYNTYDMKRIEPEQEEKLKTDLKNMGIILKRIVILSNKKGIDELLITMKAKRGKNVAIREVETVLGEIFGKKVKLMKDVGRIVTGEEKTYQFREEPNFFVMYGMAKCAKDELSVSGDNFTCLELNSGQTLVSISDGMGTGVQAYKESELVVDLLEEFAYSGFDEEIALKLINSIFTLGGEGTNPATVDMGIIDMYSGICDFVKLGAASTFVKRGNWLEVIKSTSMPIAGDESVDIESTTKKLYDGDFVIMMSDGLMEAVEKEEKEEAIGEIILGLKSLKPKEMAKEILNKTLELTKTEKEDDMTVLVTGIWDKYA